MEHLPDDLAALERSLDDIDADARQLAGSLAESLGTWREAPGSWSVAECLDHLAVGSRVYLGAMRPAAERAHAIGRARRGPARPGFVGGLFVRTMEPPVQPLFRGKAPAAIRPRPSPPLGPSLASFLAAQDEVRAFIRAYAGIDLAGTRFPNPFVRGIRFSLATGLHVIAAHDRRHLWQAWRVRRAAEQAATPTAVGARPARSPTPPAA